MTEQNPMASVRWRVRRGCPTWRRTEPGGTLHIVEDNDLFSRTPALCGAAPWLSGGMWGAVKRDDADLDVCDECLRVSGVYPA